MTLVRPATLDDAPAIQAIYRPAVVATATSFEHEPPTVEEVARRIGGTLPDLPWLVADVDNGVVGYAYASPHRERDAYVWSVETSVYVHELWRGRGVGRALYSELLAVLVMLDYVNAYAGITLPNATSVALHEACGFRAVGTFPSVGYKAGRWHDVGWWHRMLRTPPDEPARPLPYGESRAG